MQRVARPQHPLLLRVDIEDTMAPEPLCQLLVRLNGAGHRLDRLRELLLLLLGGQEPVALHHPSGCGHSAAAARQRRLRRRGARRAILAPSHPHDARAEWRGRLGHLDRRRHMHSRPRQRPPKRGRQATIGVLAWALITTRGGHDGARRRRTADSPHGGAAGSGEAIRGQISGALLADDHHPGASRRDAWQRRAGARGADMRPGVVACCPRRGWYGRRAIAGALGSVDHEAVYCGRCWQCHLRRQRGDSHLRHRRRGLRLLRGRRLLLLLLLLLVLQLLLVVLLLLLLLLLPVRILGNQNLDLRARRLRAGR
mmetsp:Transcript_1031/g.2660  ORF Transcript_1031/g.2660 Transcript_1031/m.2660 type:complete len:312 (-) Transcript_1031:1121-2056(-)